MLSHDPQSSCTIITVGLFSFVFLCLLCITYILHLLFNGGFIVSMSKMVSSIEPFFLLIYYCIFFLYWCYYFQSIFRIIIVLLVLFLNLAILALLYNVSHCCQAISTDVLVLLFQFFMTSIWLQFIFLSLLLNISLLIQV